jgi:hypothetical protein
MPVRGDVGSIDLPWHHEARPLGAVEVHEKGREIARGHCGRDPYVVAAKRADALEAKAGQRLGRHRAPRPAVEVLNGAVWRQRSAEAQISEEDTALPFSKPLALPVRCRQTRPLKCQVPSPPMNPPPPNTSVA